MKTADWFICLNYGTIELLIPQSQLNVAGLNSFSGENIPELNLDKIIYQIFKVDSLQKTMTKLLCKTADIDKNENLILTTSIIPDIRLYSYKDFHTLQGITKNSCLKAGLAGMKFSGGKILYMMDITSLLKKAGYL